jgi:hypothetical protein
MQSKWKHHISITNRNGSIISLLQLSEWTLVEQHLDDPTKAHVLLYSRKPFPKKSSDNHSLSGKVGSNEFPAIEVKGLGSHGILFVSPSVHQNGTPYQILGTLEPVIADDFVNHIDNICRKYSIPYLDAAKDWNGKALTPIQDLFKPDFTIFEGHNRHEALMRAMESLVVRNSGILSLEEIRTLAQQWNLRHCSPPLDHKEFEKQWTCAIDFVAKKGPKPEEDNDKGLRSAADILVQLAIENTTLLFKDQYGTAHAQIHIADHNEILRVEGSKFKRYLARSFYEKNGNKVVNAESITNAIQVIQAKAEYEGNTIPLSVKVAWHDDNIYYDMCNEKWQCVRISREGWEVVDATPIPIFVRFNQTPQADPNRTYEQNIFDRFLQLTNLNEDQDRILLKVYILSLFIPDIPHAMLILHGEKGSAKSTLQTLIKLLVDPGKPTLLTIHNDRSEFVQQLAHNHIAYYDNVKNTPGWLSDEACKAVTGIGQTKRKLYSDDDDIVYEYKRCLGFNGINTSLMEPDALDRSLMIELDRISKENRKVESDIMAEFKEHNPQLLGYIFDALVKTLQIRPALKLNDLPRMADFALWGEAIARALGYNNLEFIQAYYDNIGKQNIEAIENHPLGQEVAKFYEEEIQDKSNTWEGQPAKLLEQLDIVAQRHKINTNHKSWPKEVRWLTRRLNQIRSNLLEGLGIEVQINRLTDTSKDKSKANTSSIVIRKMTPMTPMTPIGQNHEGHSPESLETFPRLETNDSNAKYDSNQKTENHAQNTKIGEIGEIGDILDIEGDRKAVNQRVSLYQYYHCDNFQTNEETDYVRHGVKHHLYKPMFPSKVDLERHGLKPQGKSWEI